MCADEDKSLRDGCVIENGIIPIANHPRGPGAESDPLDPTEITSGEIIFDIIYLLATRTRTEGSGRSS